MNRFIALFFFVTSLSLFGLADDLEISPSSKIMVLIDTGSKSCINTLTGEYFNDIRPVHFSLSSIQFKWNRPEPLTLHFVQFKLRGGSLKEPYAFNIGSDQLLYSFYGHKMQSTVMTSPVCTHGPCFSAVTIPNAEGITSNQCAFKVGGIPVLDKIMDSYGKVRVMAYGTYQDAASGNSVPVTKEIELDYFYKGSN